MTISLFWPPIAFLIVLAATLGFFRLLAILSFNKGGKQQPGTTRPYACGEEASDNAVRPDYGQFFPFAFFFTILHVVALMLTTAVVTSGAGLLIAVLYIAGAVIGLMVLYRK